MECRCRCYYQLTDTKKKGLFHNFCAMKDHEMQTTYLRGCVIKKSDLEIRRRPRNRDAQKPNSVTFTVTVQEKSMIVCRAAFLGFMELGLIDCKEKY